MIAWSISTALEAKCFDRVVVSTEDKEIAEISRRWGAEVPFIRPMELADDHTTMVDVVRHAIGALKEHDGSLDTVCALHAVAPFARADDVVAASQLLGDCDFVIPVAEYAAPIERAMQIDEHGNLGMIHPQQHGRRTQDAQASFYDAAQFYWAWRRIWASEKPVFEHRVRPYRLDRSRVLDIDTEEDWAFAEILFTAMNSGSDQAKRGSL